MIWIRRLEDWLLVNHPEFWVMRAHYVVPGSLLAIVLAFVLGHALRTARPEVPLEIPPDIAESLNVLQRENLERCWHRYPDDCDSAIKEAEDRHRDRLSTISAEFLRLSEGQHRAESFHIGGLLLVGGLSLFWCYLYGRQRWSWFQSWSSSMTTFLAMIGLLSLMHSPIYIFSLKLYSNDFPDFVFEEDFKRLNFFYLMILQCVTSATWTIRHVGRVLFIKAWTALIVLVLVVGLSLFMFDGNEFAFGVSYFSLYAFLLLLGLASSFRSNSLVSQCAIVMWFLGAALVPQITVIFLDLKPSDSFLPVMFGTLAIQVLIGVLVAQPALNRLHVEPA